MSSPAQPINIAAKRSGLSPHVIRVWERRYKAVTPQRTGKNRRVYSDEDIRRLTLLRRVTESGQSISFVAHLDTERLEQLAGEHAPTASPASRAAALATTDGSPIDTAVAAVRQLDAAGLRAVLAETESKLGLQGLLQRLVAPFAEQLGELWRTGAISAAHEHFASAALRTYLGLSIRPYAAADHPPVIVVATPHGQLHELGALIVAAFASNLGWKVVYLSTSLAPADIAGAAKQNEARLVALSIVYPNDDPRLEADLTKLRELMPADIGLVVGGRAAGGYQQALDAVGALQPESLDDFGRLLDEVRRRTSPAPSERGRPRRS